MLRSRPVLSTAAAALIALTAPAAAGAKAKGFELGVTAGEVTSSSAMLWGKAKKPGKVLVQLTRRGGFDRCTPRNAAYRTKAKRSNDSTVQVTARKLSSRTSYRFRFCTARGARSDVGKFTTAPPAKRAKTVSFGLAGDQDARPLPGGGPPYWNNFEIWNAIRAQRNDFNVLLGDTIYSDTEVPGYTLNDVALSVKEKQAAYAANLAMKPWAKARGSAAYYGSWDDHEFVNDFARGEDSSPPPSPSGE